MKYILPLCLCLLMSLTAACGVSDRAATIEGLSGDAAKGKTLYDQDCASCHGADGKGTPRGDTLVSDHVKNHSDGELADVIIDGDGSMPAYGTDYSDQDIADVLAHIRTLQ